MRRIVLNALAIAVVIVGIAFTPAGGRVERAANIGVSVTPGPAHVLDVVIVLHPYADPEKDEEGPQPIPCDGGAAPGRVVADVYVTVDQAGIIPHTFTFGIVGGSRGGADRYIWITETRTVWLPAGTSKVENAADQIFPAPGTYFFRTAWGSVGEKMTAECVVTHAG